MDYPDKKKLGFKSRLDLDYDSFVTKKIERCGRCGDIFYAGIHPPHACSTDNGSPSIHPQIDAHAEATSHSGNPASARAAAASTRQNEHWLGAYCGADRNRLCDKIYAIWEQAGFRRHFKESGTITQENKEAAKDKFSFSPYDNFF